MTQIIGTWITTLENPCAYTPAQLDKACRLAHLLHRGQLVLTEPPRR